MITFSINGVAKSLDIDPRIPLLDVLREDLGLKGTKYGCGEGECGACTVIVDGKSACSCLVLAGSVEGGEVTTIEGISNDPVGVSLVSNLAAEGGVQCGFCTPGFVMQGWQASQQSCGDLRRDLGGNLCRCTGYEKIVCGIQKTLDRGLSSPLSLRKGHGGGLLTEGYWRPVTLDELQGGLADLPQGARFLAGGTDLVVQHKHDLDGLFIVDLGEIAALAGVEDEGESLRIGATTTWQSLIATPLVQRFAPVLAMAAREIGAGQIQNSATIGGNIVNASPAADGLPPLYAHEARVVILGPQGTREIAIADFVLGPRKTALAEGECVIAVLVPKREGARHFFEKVGPRQSQTISKVSLAYLAYEDAGPQVRVALGAVAPTVIRLPQVEAHLARGGDTQVAVEMIRAAVSPIDDIRSTAGYRRQVAGGLLLRGLVASEA